MTSAMGISGYMFIIYGEGYVYYTHAMLED